MLGLLVFVCSLVLVAGYLCYGRFLSRAVLLNDNNTTPACAINDGVDYVPAPKGILMGQHFSAISAAGPIVGPILAGLWFGWLPAILWILVGSIFIGGTHDFLSLVASVRHRGASMGEIIRQYTTPKTRFMFLAFVWISLVYVICAFTDVTAQTFKTVTGGTAFGPGVAVTSFIYLVLGVVMGFVTRRFKMGPLLLALIFVPCVLAAIWFGPHCPAPLLNAIERISIKEWDMILLAYCFIASITPVWILLQPRGFLGGCLLYMVMGAGLTGALFAGFDIHYPAVNMTGLHSMTKGLPLVPVLFITVACGAISGFHSIVSTGTTSKQIMRERDTLPIGYGSMLLEAFVAVLALATVMVLKQDDPLLKSDPNMIFANGIARYLELAHIDYNIALSFALLAFSTFVYDTLDVTTRLGRYVLQEMLGWRSRAGVFAATAITLLMPMAFLLLTREKAYLVAWPIFGTSNQMLASLVLLALAVWLIRTNKNAVWVLVPAAFMLVMTFSSLWLKISALFKALPGLLNGGAAPTPDVLISGVAGLVLAIVGIWLVIEMAGVVLKARRQGHGVRL
ncbi:MAG: carbon starvation protein A [Deltaproteobacteria bacterium]|nr:carbon starvation protein A [Deltaproteobacteria bacterium]